MQFGVAAAMLAGCFGMVPSLMAPAIAQSQQNAPRTVQGRILDKAGAPLKGATVFLKDGHTLAVRSYISGDDGGYRFAQLSQNTDYELWAESDGKKSAVRNISAFESKTQLNFDLKIDK
jgi:Carboxypeptidase regulatory-like domain